MPHKVTLPPAPRTQRSAGTRAIDAGAKLIRTGRGGVEIFKSQDGRLIKRRPSTDRFLRSDRGKS